MGADARGCSSATHEAYIADNTAPENRARSFALIGIAFGIGFLLGPAITAYLSRWGMSAPLFLAAGLSLTSLSCTALLLPRDEQRRELPAEPTTSRRPPSTTARRRFSVLRWDRFATSFQRPVLGGVLGEFLLYQLAFSMFMSGFALFAERRYTYEGQLRPARDRARVRLRRARRHRGARGLDGPLGAQAG